MPSLTISGAGLDLENVTSTDLVASVMNIVAPIYGGENEVNLRAGDDGFNYGSKVVSSSGVGAGNNLPTEVAIDASVLGKIQAGKIFIIATKEGFGIKYSGDLLASRNGIVIDGNGNVEYNNIAAEVGDVEVVSRNGGIVGNGVVQTKDAGFDIKLNSSDDIINRGQFLSAKDIDIETLGEFRNESSALNLSDNDFFVNAVDFVNLGQISAGRDLSVEAVNLVNSAKLVGGRNLSLTAARITNDDSIYANNKITISASDFFTNIGEVVSIGEGLVDGILISAKTLNNNKQIAAKNNVVINANIFNNNTANSTVLGLNDVGLNVVEIDNSGASVVAGNNLVLRNLVLSEPTIANSFGVNSQGTKITYAGGTFFAGNFLDFDLGNLADYVMVGTLESAGDIKIKANNITNKTSVKANGNIEIIADDKFTNGVFGGDNSGNKIIAGDSLNITATNLLSNYGTVSSQNNLTLASTFGNINNNASAEIIGGSGKLSLIARNGTVNQNSLNSLISNGDLTLDVANFVNTGRVDIAGDFTLNVSSDLINEANALIYSGGDMTLNVVNNLTNNSGAVIYSQGDLTIQKYAQASPNYNAANNKSNSVKNISGQIISYDGNMRIDAATISNERAINPFNSVFDPQTDGPISSPQAASFDQYSWQLNNNGCFGHECENRYWGYYAKQLTNSDSIASSIQSGGTLTFNAGTLDNLGSNISAAGNITINADTLNNHSINDPGLYYMTTTWGSRIIYSLGTTNYIRHDPGNGSHTGSRLNYNDFAQNNPSTIKSGGSITLNVVNNVSNATTNQNANTGIIATQNPQLVNSIDVDELSRNGVVSADFSNYLNGPDNQGLFTKNPNPNAPLFESRSQFIDQSKFFGSDYFYNRIGLDLDELQTQLQQQDQRMIGDQFFQNRIIEEQLRTITKNSVLLSNNNFDANAEIKSMFDNAASEYARLGLDANKSLTKTQIAGLQKDIIWFETQTIDGATYIVPKIYLTQETRNNLANGALANNSTIFAAGDVNITSAAGAIVNAGSIAGNNVSLAAAGNVTNKNFSNISATNDLSITSATGSIVNFSQINAGGAASLTAAVDVVNSSTVLTNDAALLASGNVGYVSNGMGSANSGFISSRVLETAGISAGSLAVNAGGDFKNQAANIDVAANAEITAGNDVSFATLELRNRTETSWGHKSKGGSSVVDKTTNVASNVNVGGNLDVATTGLGLAAEQANIDVLNAQIQAQHNSDVVAYNQAVVDRNIQDNFRASMKRAAPEPVAPVAPQFYADAASNINIVGSNITTGGDLNIAAKDGVNIASAVDSYHKEERSNSKSSTVKKTYFATTDNVTNVSSNLTSGADINISSGGDTNIIASNLTGAANGNILVGAYTDYDQDSATYGQTLFNDDSNLNILNSVDSRRFYSESTKIKTGLSLENALMTAAMVAAVAFSGGAAAGVILASGAAGGAVGAVNVQKTTKTELRYDETVISSNLKFGNDLTLSSMNDVTLQAAKVEASGDLTINATNNLIIATASEAHQTSYETKDKGNYFLSNGNSGFYQGNAINTEIVSNGGTNSNLAFNVGNSIVAQYNKSSGDNSNGIIKTGLDGSILYGDFSGNSRLAYLDKLDSNITLYNPVEEINKSWSQTTRGLTGAGQAVVAITATALTAGSMGPIGGSWTQGALVAGSSAAASTAAVAATNAAMNADGDIFKQLKTISKDTWDTTTSRESVKNIVIAAAAGGLAVGAGNFANTGSFSAPATNGANTISASASWSERVGANLKNSFQEVAINTVSSTAAQSAISGESFVDALKSQGKNILIYTAAKVGANEIGRAYHGSTVVDANGNVVGQTSSTIGKPEQLLLHAGLGAATSALTGNDAASGAVAGVAGELAAEGINKAGANIPTSIQAANLTGAISSVTYGGLTGQSDEQMADNAWEGSRIGQNAGENNALYFRDKKIKHTDWITTKDVKDFDLNIGVQGNLTHVNGSYGTDGAGLAIDLNPSIGGSTYFSVSPRGETVVGSNTLGFKNLFFSGGPLYTNKGNAGFTGSLGLALPLYPVPVNATVNIPLDKLHNSNK